MINCVGDAHQPGSCGRVGSDLNSGAISLALGFFFGGGGGRGRRDQIFIFFVLLEFEPKTAYAL